jgi:hypothetical protein
MVHDHEGSYRRYDCDMASEIGHLLSVASRTVLLSTTAWAGCACGAQGVAEANASGALPAACSVAGSTGHVASYLNDSLPQLKGYVRALKGLKFEEHPAADESEKILDETGEAITALMPRVPNLIAREELSQAALALPYVIGSVNTSSPPMTRGGRGGMSMSSPPAPTTRLADAGELQAAMEKILKEPKNKIMLTYRIQSNEGGTSGALFQESRTDAQNRPIASGEGAGNPHGTGFGGIWMMFEPTFRKEFTFRYLGREKLDKRETAVVAFAQSPERALTPAVISMAGGSCTYFTQGVVWIDPATHQIVRLETDLLAPLTALHVTRLHSETDFAEVKIPARALTLWLPSKVEIDWQTPEQAGAEMHRYSEYRLFGATSRLVTEID